MLNCARCHRLVVICSRCDRGQRYCSGRCAQAQRRRSIREAGRRYQRTPLGARNNAARQKRWRVRIVTTVTHHTSPIHKHLREEPPGKMPRRRPVMRHRAVRLPSPTVRRSRFWPANRAHAATSAAGRAARTPEEGPSVLNAAWGTSLVGGEARVL